MPVRATKRGAERTPLSGEWDVLICGASFAGLAAARELRASRARVLVLDRYEIGERQTSACAVPTEWLVNLGLEGSIRQTFDEIVVHTPKVSARWSIPWSFSTFDYRHLCELLWEQCGEAEFETAKVDGRTGFTVHTDRGDLDAPLIVDALGWRRVLSNGATIQPPDARLSRGLEVHPKGTAPDLELWLDTRYISPGYGWSFPAGDEVRIGVGSFDPKLHVKEPTLDLVGELDREPDGWQGNWIPHYLRPAAEDGVFFAGDSAGHCLPLTAEGIRTALYFGVACGRELRSVLEGRQDRSTALRRYSEFSDGHAWKFRWMFRAQQALRHLHGRPADRIVRAFENERLTLWSFTNYLNVAPPSFALPAPPPASVRFRTNEAGVARVA
jgi:flavin-dependent dehydrogenase